MISLSFKARHRRFAAGFALLVWSIALSIGAARACLPPQAPHQVTSDSATANVVAHAVRASPDSEPHPDACRISCDMQTQDVAKKKSIDSPDPEQPDHLPRAYFLPGNPAGILAGGGPDLHSRLYQPNASLRLTRLTL